MNKRTRIVRRRAPIRQAGHVMLTTSAALLSLGLALGADERGPGTAPGAVPAPAPAARPVAVPAYRQANQVAVLTISGEIDHMTLRSLERRIEQAVADGADAIVLDIDTPGGRLDATLDICNLLKDPSATPPNTVAWIHPQAYSAGTIIALACREIVVAPNATFGDAAPIHGIPVVGLVQMAPTERAKIEAPILAEVIDSGRRNHYDENLVQSFVSVGVELWLIEKADTGQRVVVDRPEYVAVFGEDPPQQMTPLAPPAIVGPVPRVAPRYQTLIPRPDPEQSETLSPEEIRAQIEFQQQLPPSRLPLTEDERGKWRPVTQIISNDRLLTVKAGEALFYGLAVTTIADDTQLQKFFGAQAVTRYDRTLVEALVGFLVSMPVRIVLIVVFLLGLFIELAAPGIGAFGATAVGALIVLIGAPYLAGMAQWWDVLLIVVGMLLLGLEILVIPGTGITGIAGALCLLVGLVGTFVTGDLSTVEGQEELGRGIASILAALFAAGVGMWLLSRHLDSFAFFNRLVLKTELGGGLRTSEPQVGLLEAMGGARRGGLEVGAVGIAETDLRPSGRGRFGDRIMDVQSDGRYIEKGTRVQVTKVSGPVIEVEEAPVMTLLSLAQAATTANDTYFLWGCLLFAAAVVLLFIEFFVPSGGLLGLLCGISAIGSIVAFFMYDTAWGVGIALGYIVLTPITLVFVFKLWLNSPVGKAMILGPGDQAADPEVAVIRSEEERQERLAQLRQLIGAEGITETALRPVGTVRINGRRTDGLAETGIIEANTPVVVTDIYDNQIKVRPR